MLPSIHLPELRQVPALAKLKTAALAVAVVGLCACSTTLPNQIRAGGSFLASFDPDQAKGMGFSSAYGGFDPQRPAVRFSLCPVQELLCPLEDRASGAALETQLMTRVQADPFAPAALRGAVEFPRIGVSMPLPGSSVALLRVPPPNAGGPAPGRYRLEARVTTPDGSSDLLQGRGPEVEILEGRGQPATLPVPGALPQLVPLPRITLTAELPGARDAAGAASESGPAAAELLLRYPSSRARVRGLAEVGQPVASSLLSLTPGPSPDTVRVALMAPSQRTLRIGVAFALIDPTASPVRPEDFEILEQRLYDAQGAPDESIRFRVDSVIE